MHIHASETRNGWWTAKINWSRELTFSERQIRFILDSVPNERGVYCIYAKDYKWPYDISGISKRRWSPLVYIGSGYLCNRLKAHLSKKKNDILAEYLARYQLAYRYERIYDDDPDIDWPRQVEASFLEDYEDEFCDMPPANRRRERYRPVEGVKRFYYEETGAFSILDRG